MRFTDFFLKKPVFAIVLNLFVLLLGILSFFKLDLREYPPFEAPILSVETKYKGASAEIVEGQITKPLEKHLADLADLDYSVSHSNFEQSWIELHFKNQANLDEASGAIRAELNKIQNQLPKSANQPELVREAKDSKALLTFVLLSKSGNMMDASEYAHKFLKSRFKSIDGVGSVKIDGVKRLVMITLDPIVLAAHHLSVQDVINAFDSSKDFSAGVRQIGDQRLDITATAKFSSIEKLEGLILKRNGKSLITLADVGKIAYAPDPLSTISVYNGKKAPMIDLLKKAGANPVDVSKDVLKELPLIKEGLPEDLELKLLYNGADFIEKAMDAVGHTLLEAVLLVGLVMFIFLRSAKLTFVPLITIPFSLVAAFIVLYGFGYSLNRLTMLAFVLAIGLVVDDAIVVLENIYRKSEEGLKPLEAALKGMREIAFSVIAMTLTLAVVFIPLVFIEGSTGRLFKEFAVALSGSVLFSGFIALTFSPLLSKWIIERGVEHHDIKSTFYEKMYLRKLKSFLKLESKQVAFLASFAFLIGLASYWFLTKELIPQEDRGMIKIGATTRGAFTQDYFAKQVEPIADFVKHKPDVTDFFSVTYNNYFEGTLVLKPFEKRHFSSKDLIEKFDKRLSDLPGVWAWAYQENPLQQDDPSSLDFIIQSSVHKKDLLRLGQMMMNKIKRDGHFKHVHLKSGKPKSLFKFKLNREKIAAFDINMDAIHHALEAAMGGYRGLSFETTDNDYDVLLQTVEENDDLYDTLSSSYVKAKDGDAETMIPVSSLLEEKLISGPDFMYHFNGVPAVSLQVSLAPHVSIQEGITLLQRYANRLLPPNTQTDLAGGARQMKDSYASFFMLFALSALFIYFILAAQFESFIDPLIILVSVPLSVIGALFLMLVFGQTLNVYSQIGLITLVGLMTKHGILLVDFANKRAASGFAFKEAMIEAVRLRLRPILMTTGAMVFGAIPLVLSHGVGSESYTSIGVVLLGGLLLGTLLTLFFVPYVYVRVKGR